MPMKKYGLQYFCFCSSIFLTPDMNLHLNLLRKHGQPHLVSNLNLGVQKTVYDKHIFFSATSCRGWGLCQLRHIE